MAYADLNDWENVVYAMSSGAYLILFAVYLVVFYIYTSHVNKLVLHVNLKLLLLHLPIPCLINMFAQCINRIQFFLDIEKIKTPWYHPLIVISDIPAFANYYQLDVLIIERAFATVWVSTYEELGKKFPFFAVSLIVGQWTLSTLTFCAGHVEYLNYYITCFIGASNLLIAILVFVFLPRISRKIHDEFLPPSYEVLKLKQKSWTVNLSQRYQSCENLRVSFLIKVIIAVEMISVFAQIGIHATVRSLVRYTFSWYMTLLFSYVNLSFHALLIMLIVIQPFFSTIDSCRAIKKTVVPIESPEIINKIYFDTYEKAWA